MAGILVGSASGELDRILREDRCRILGPATGGKASNEAQLLLPSPAC